MKTIKTYEEFVGDLETRALKSKAIKKQKEDDDEIVGDLDTNDPDRSYDDEADGDDQINRHPINF